jgi:hypothetical protein
MVGFSPLVDKFSLVCSSIDDLLLVVSFQLLDMVCFLTVGIGELSSTSSFPVDLASKAELDRLLSIVFFDVLFPYCYFLVLLSTLIFVIPHVVSVNLLFFVVCFPTLPNSSPLDCCGRSSGMT